MRRAAWSGCTPRSIRTWSWRASRPASRAGPRAVLFENVKGHDAPVLTGLYWSPGAARGADAARRAHPPPIRFRVHRGVAEPARSTGDDRARIGLRRPVRGGGLAAHPRSGARTPDGGPYFDAGVVIARDPDTGVRNASIQRFMVVDERTLHVNIDAGRHLELYLDKARARGKTLAFSLNCGVGPGLHFAAATPGRGRARRHRRARHRERLPRSPPGARRGQGVAGARGGQRDVRARMRDRSRRARRGGSLREVTGYYARRDPRPVVHVRAMHVRPNPIFQTILSGVEVWNSVGLLGEANVLGMLQRQVPGIRNVYFSHGGCGFYHAVVSIRQTRAGWSKQAILAAFAAFPPLKMVTVVDDDVDIRDVRDVEWAMATRLDPAHGIIRIDNVFGHGLNPASPTTSGPRSASMRAARFPTPPSTTVRLRQRGPRQARDRHPGGKARGTGSPRPPFTAGVTPRRIDPLPLGNPIRKMSASLRYTAKLWGLALL